MIKKNFLLILTIVILISGCDRIREATGGGEEQQAAIEVPVFAVNTTLAVQGQIQDYLSLSGDIWAGSTVDVFPEAAGRIAEIYTAVGRTIGRGQAVAAIDPSRPGMEFRFSVATAPISGTVIAVPAQIGMTVSPAVPLARISAGGGLELRLNVAERFISQIALNQPCEITLDAWPGETFRGSIREISPTVDMASRTMEVRVNIANRDGMLKPGMFAKVRVITEIKDNIVKIPASAIVNRFGEQIVFVTEKDADNFDIVRRRAVVPGIVIDGVAEILSGLEPNEEIVLRGQTLLDDGSRVNIIGRTMPLGE